MSALESEIEENIRSSFARQKLMVTIGATLDSVDAGAVSVGLSWRDDLTQQNGFLHAGVITAVLDSACGYAALSLMPPGSDVVSVEFKVNLLAPAVGEKFVTRARVKRSGRTLTVTDADCWAVNPDGEKLVATMLGTMMRIGRHVP